MRGVGMQKGKLWGRGMATVILVAGTLALTGNAALAAGNVEISEANFPDAKFRVYVSGNFDTDENGILNKEEIEAVTEIRYSSYYTDRQIKSLRGVEFFNNLKLLDCSFNQLSSLDISKNTALEVLYCGNNQLSNLDVSKNTALETLSCKENPLGNIDLSANTALRYLYCEKNQLSSLDVSKNTALQNLYCSENQLDNLDVSRNMVLSSLDCEKNRLSELDVSQNTAMKVLTCSGNQLSNLELSNLTVLSALYCDKNKLSNLDVSRNTVLTALYCSENQLSNLDVSKNTALRALGCGRNQLSRLDLSKNTGLTYLFCGDNKLSKLDLNRNKALEILDCNYNQLSDLDVSKNAALKSLYCYGNQLRSLDLSANTTLKRVMLNGNKSEWTLNGADAWEYNLNNAYLVFDKATLIFTKDVTEVKKYVTRMYETCLFREPDEDGLNGWAGQLANGNMNGAEIAEQFIFSQELLECNLSNEDFVEILYNSMMGRTSDVSGKNGWVSQLANGNMSRSEVTKCFVESTEFSGICADYGIVRGTYDASIAPIEKFVERLYKLCLERNADQAGLYGWVGNLKNGNMNGAQMANSFFFSDEFINKNVSNEKYVELLYNTLMGRHADADGKAGWVSQLQGGHMDRRAVMKAFIESAEFTDICANYNIARGSF